MISSFFLSLFSLSIELVHALTATELDKFSVDASITTNQGTRDGATLTPSLTVSSSGSSHTFAGNMVPPHATGSAYTMPITTYLSAQNSAVEVPSSPVKATSTTCLPAGTAGIAVNGVSVFSAYSRPCTDAVADEAIGFDSCDGHPQERGVYHYHYKSECLQVKSASSGGDSTIVTSAGNQQLFGVALDGFPIYNKWDANGNTIANSQLDTCHGYDAGDGIGYRYIVNDEFPYIIGCYVGTPLTTIRCHCTEATELTNTAQDSASDSQVTTTTAALDATTAAGAAAAQDASGAKYAHSWNIGVGVALSSVFAWALEM